MNRDTQLEQISTSMYNQITKDDPSLRASTFIQVPNIYRVLLSIRNSISKQRQQQRPEINWEFVFHEMIRPFCATENPYKKQANLLFFNDYFDPWLLYDSLAWRKLLEMEERKYKSIDVTQKRRAPRNPAVMGYGTTRNMDASTFESMNTRSFGNYLLSHPFSSGYERRMKALSLTPI